MRRFISSYIPNSRLRRALLALAAAGSAILAIVLGSTLIQQARKNAMLRELNTVREWPRLSGMGQGVETSLRTVCQTFSEYSLGAFKYEFRIFPADSAELLLRIPSPPELTEAEQASLDSANAEAEARRSPFQRMTREMALSLVVPATRNQFVIELFDSQGFRAREIVVTADSLVREMGREGEDLVANRQAAGGCSSEFLNYASWRVRVEPERTSRF